MITLKAFQGFKVHSSIAYSCYQAGKISGYFEQDGMW